MDTLSEKQDLISSRLVEYDGEGEITAEWTESGAALFAQQASPRYISLEEALKLKDRTEVLFVDARTSAEFLRGHIPGAVRVGRKTFDKDYLENGDRLRVARKLVVYCSSRQCEDSSIVATKLSQLGHRDILIFEGGWAEWWKRNR